MEYMVSAAIALVQLCNMVITPEVELFCSLFLEFKIRQYRLASDETVIGQLRHKMSADSEVYVSVPEDWFPICLWQATHVLECPVSWLDLLTLRRAK